MAESARIVVIDDEVRMCESLEKLLNQEGYQVRAFVDPLRARQALADQGDFDCVLTDIKMPGTDGLEILRTARARDPLAPVILMTGYASLESAVEAVNEGAYDYLLKPIEFPHLRQTIERGLAKRRSDQGRLDLLNRLTQQNRLLRGRLKEHRALHGVGVSVSSVRPLDEVLHRLLLGATQVTGAERGSILLLEADELSIRAAIGLPPDVVASTRLKLSEGISGYVARTGEAVRVADVATDHRFARTPHPRYESRSFLSVPLRVAERTLGVLNVSSRQGGGVFRARDLRVLTIFAAQAATLIDDAFLFETHRRQLAEQKVLYRIAHEVATSEHFDQVARAMYDSLREILPLDFGLWLAWNSVRGVLHHRFLQGEAVDPRDWADFVLPLKPESWQDETLFQALVTGAVQAHPAWDALRAVLAVLPIRLEDQPRGALLLGSRTARELSDGERRMAAIAASQAAAAYERHQDALTTRRLATMGHMVSEIAHDLKKPLTNLKGSLQLLRQKHAELGEGDPYLRSAEQEIQHLSDLVRELVDFSNPVRYPLDRVSLHEPLARALKLISEELSRRGIELHTELTDRPVMVRGQESEIVQALLNVLHNATDSMQAGGRLAVKTSIEAAPNAREECAVVYIRDSGCGIPERDLAKVFARHYTTKEGGSGLGLAIVERIMQAHNGHVAVKSQPGAGTEMALYFPLDH
jgi:signal transduction histidine kinase/FixJ family two-component response regulator/putative methionine-R-sulfoxide reductase with GAF domain